MKSSSPELSVNPKFLPGADDKPPSDLILGAVLAVVIAIGFSPWLLTKMARETPPSPVFGKGADMSSPSNWRLDAKWHHSQLLRNNFNLVEHSQYAARMQREKKFAKAVQAYTMLIEGAGRYRAQNYLQRGLAYFNLGRYDLAIADFNNTIALDPVEADAYRGRSEAYRQLGKSDLAAADMMRFAKLNR